MDLSSYGTVQPQDSRVYLFPSDLAFPEHPESMRSLKTYRLFFTSLSTTGSPSASAAPAKKLVFKVSRPTSTVATPTPPFMLAPTSPMQPTSPGLSSASSAAASSQNKPGRFVFKHTPSPAPPTTVTAQPEDYGAWPSLAAPVADPRSYRREPAPIEHTAPPVKRRKELEYDDYGHDSTTSSSAVKKKNWVPLRKMLNNALKKLIDLDGYKFFYEPVTEKEAPGYFAVIKRPMDFSTMRRKMLEDKYPYWTIFVEDFELICQNCINYNLPNSIYWNEAKTLLLEGKKYLKVQATKINPELLQAPENFNSTANATANGDNTAALARMVLEKPKRLYIRNEALPRELASAPPPVHFAKVSDVKGPVYPFQDPTVAKGTPQQQAASEPVSWTGFTVTSDLPSSHWKRLVPAYISYTRGYPEFKSNYAPRDRKIRSRNNSTSAATSVADYENLARASYVKSIAKLNRPVSGLLDLDTLPQEEKYRFDALSRILLPEPGTESEASFFGVSADSLEIDTSLVGGTLQPTSETAGEIRDLLSTLSGSQIDLSFLDKLFTAEESAKAPSAATSALLERSSELSQLLQVSTLQRRFLDSSLPHHESHNLLELSANLTTLATKMPTHSLSLNALAASRLRANAEAGLGTHPHH